MSLSETWGHYPQHLWGHIEHSEPQDQDYETGKSAPYLHGLWRAVTNHHTTNSQHGDYDYVGESALEHHFNGNKHFAMLEGDTWGHDFNRMAGERHLRNLQDAANIKPKRLKDHISPRTRALLHDPAIASDSAEDEGYPGIARILRHGRVIDTYPGKDEARLPDVAFHHRGHVHLLVGHPASNSRLHFVMPLGR